MKNRNPATPSRTKVRSLVIVGMMAALTMVMALTPLGFLRLPLISITLLHLPTIIITILEGPWMGMATGLMFGLASWYNAATTAGLLNVFFLNPVISVLPRLIIAPVTWAVYRGMCKLFKKERQVLPIAVSAVVGTLTNTVGVLGLLYVVYAQDIVTRFAALAGENAAAGAAVAQYGMLQDPFQGVALFLWATVVTNAIPECAVAVIAAIPVILAVRKLDRTPTALMRRQAR